MFWHDVKNYVLRDLPNRPCTCKKATGVNLSFLNLLFILLLSLKEDFAEIKDNLEIPSRSPVVLLFLRENPSSRTIFRLVSYCHCQSGSGAKPLLILHYRY